MTDVEPHRLIELGGTPLPVYLDQDGDAWQGTDDRLSSTAKWESPTRGEVERRWGPLQGPLVLPAHQ